MHRLDTLLLACAAAAALCAPAAHADPVLHAHRGAAGTAGGGLTARSGFALHGAEGGAAGRRRVVADGEGRVHAAGASGFSTADGGQGRRSGQLHRDADGSVEASMQARASGSKGSAERSGSYSRDGDGNASAERSTTATNANTGVTFEGATSYTQGSGFSRSASCSDADGNTVTCGSR